MWVARNNKKQGEDSAYVFSTGRPTPYRTDDGQVWFVYEGRDTYIKSRIAIDFEEATGIRLMPGEGPFEVPTRSFTTPERIKYDVAEDFRRERQAGEVTGHTAEGTQIRQPKVPGV